jgi:AraC-like DNA-binding protein
MFLTKMTKQVSLDLSVLARVAGRLPSPANPLQGRRRPPPALPENIIFFQRRNTDDLNHPARGRALHHRHVLIVPLRGEAMVCVDDRELRLAPGAGLMVLPYQFHSYKRSAGRRILWLFVTFEYPEGVTLEPLRNAIFAVTPEIAGHLERLLKESQGLPELRLALLLSLLAPAPGCEGGAVASAGRDQALVARVNHAVQASRPRMPTVRELAGALGMSASHLRERFRASCGVSLGRHVRALRLERAQGLLRMSPARVTEIAEQCGYPSVYSFSRAFRNAYGCSPRAYRKEGAP